MSNILKDIAILLFTAGDEIESKAQELKNEREKRYEQFEELLKEGRENIKSGFSEEINRAKDGISELTDKLGFASKKEIKELKDVIDELNAKIDRLSGAK